MAELNEDFDIDTGIDMSYLDDANMNFDEAFGDNETTDNKIDNTQGNEIEGAKSAKKTAIILGIIGFVVIVIALFIASLVGNSNNKKEASVEETKAEITAHSAYTSKENIPAKLHHNEGWIEFKANGDVVIDVEIDSDFTVTSIRHFAKVVNENNDKIVKSIVTGNISGLVGTYEVEIPYEKAIKLKVGSVFKITYKCNADNDSKIIGEIKY